jgi:hypothetical protein
VLVVAALALGGCSESGVETSGDAVGTGVMTQAPSASSELIGAGSAAIGGVGTIAPEAYRRNAARACEEGNEDACRVADEWERGEGPPIFVDGEPRKLYPVGTR